MNTIMLFGLSSLAFNSLRRIFLIGIILLFSLKVTAQVPTITNISAQNAINGSSFTITGTNFNTTSANNIVYIGKQRATVTAATSTSLTATAPSGGTYGKVSVLNTATRLQGESQAFFSTRFPPAKNSLSAADFTLIGNLPDVGGGLQLVASGSLDLNGDGKPEMISLNPAASEISVFPNTSSGGTVSFGAPVAVAMSNFCNRFAIADMDADGRKDLVLMAPNAGYILIFLNTGDISTFGETSNINVGTFLSNITLSDINKDGRIDILVSTSSTGFLYIYPNFSTPGFLTIGSFTSFSLGANAAAIGATDLNGDNMPDIVATFSGGISIYKNLGTPGGAINSSSFSTAGTAAPNTSLSLTSATTISFADFDNDGKTDLATSNGQSAVYTFINNYTTAGGNLSFTAGTTITTGRNVATIATGDVTGDGKPDILAGMNVAFATNDYRLAIIPNQTTTAGTLVFGTAAELAVGNAPTSSDIVDLDNDGRADFFTGNLASRTVSVYQNTTLPPPVINSFSPANAAPGANITITGTGFNSTPANNKVLIGGSKATVTAASATSLTVTVPKGALYGYVTVTNTANALTAYSKNYFLPTIQTPKGVLTAADIPYQGSATSSAAQRIYGMVTGDLNGDGKPDLVTAANGPATLLENALQVYFNTTATTGGNITLATPNTYTFTGNNGQGMPALADLDGDGNLDIIAIASTRDLSTNIASSGNMYVLRNQGTGAFTASSAFTTGLGPNACFAIDMDGDGLPDVATLNTTGASVSIFRNLSSGAGNISFAAKNDYSITANPIMIFFADLDGDGKPDLIIPRSGASGFDVKLNTSSPGNISFANSQTISGSNSPISVTGGDIDGDGKTDLILTFAGSSTNVLIYRNTSSGAGNISFATSTVAVGTSQQVATLGDLNGDGKPDLVVAPDGSSPGKLIVYRNTSVVNTVSFDELSRIELTDPLNFSRGLAVADFNNDGVNDLVAGVTNLARFYIYRGIMQFPPTIASITPAKAAPGTSIVITGTNFNVLTTGNVVYFGAVRATVTSASATSLTVTVPAGASYGPVTVTHTTNRLTGQSSQYFHPVFAPNKSTLAATDFRLQSTITGSNLGRGFTLADLDADGKPDIVDAENILSNSVHFRKNNSTTAAIGFATAVDMNNGLYSTPEYIRTKDIDGDGKPDVLMTNSSTDQLLVALNTGDLSTITHTAAFATGASPRGLDAGDLDGDGRIDVVVANAAGSSVSVFRNVGNTAGQATFGAKIDLSTTTSAYHVYLADMDGDGKLDIVTNGGPGGGIYHVIIWRNTTTAMGSISFDAPYTLAASAVQNILKLGDFDNDGKIDIIAANGSGSVFTLFNNNSSSGSLSFGAAQNITIPYPGFINDVSVGDLNGDGKADLSFSYASSPRSLVLYTNTTATAGSITFDSPITFAVTAAVGKNYIQDANGDGRPDIFSVDYNTHTIQIFQNSLIVPPVTQATNITVTPTGTTADIGWTSGSGDKRAVFMLEGSNGTPALVTGTDYTANATFTSGAQIGTSGWYCVYSGTGNSLTVTGLQPSKTYRLMVVEFNDGGQLGAAQYNATAATNNPINFTTSTVLNSIERSGSNANVNTATVDYTITFGSAITGLTTSNFSVTTSAGITGASVQSITGSGAIYTVTINTGSGNGTLVLNLSNATGLNTSLTNTFPFVGETYTIDKTSPTLTTVSIVSSNIDATLAKIGDIATLTFVADEVITPTVTINGHSVTPVNVSGNSWSAAYTFLSSDTEGVVTYNITYDDLAGNSGTPVATGAGSVTFDRTVPAIPAGLTGTAGDQQVVLNWTANMESDLSAYRILYGTSPSPTMVLTDIAGGTTTYTHSSLTNGTTYYYIIQALDKAGNISVASTVTSAIPKANQAITFNTIAPKTYGDASFTLGNANSSAGLVVTYTALDPTVVSISGNQATILKAGTTKITASQVGNNAYNAANIVEQSLTVLPKGIIVTPDANQSKIYGATDPAMAYTFSPSLQPGDNFSGSLGRATGENVGTYAITQGTLTAGGNYTISFTTGVNFGIMPKSITVTANAGQSKTYGVVDPVLSYTFSPSLQPGDNFSGSLGRATGENVGTYAITQGTLTAGGNYSISFTTGANFGIMPKSITVTASANQSKIYGAGDPALTYTFSPSLQTGDNFSGSLGRASGENVGTYAITQGSLSAGSNYNISFTTGTNFNIQPKSITVTAGVGQSKIYGNSDPVLSYTFSPSLQSGDSFIGSLGRASGENVGTYAITQGTLSAGSNYSISFTTGSSFGIVPKAITVTVSTGQTKIYGNSDPVLSYTFSPSLQSGDSFNGSLSRASGENVGTYAITQGSLTAGTNYTVSYIGANLTITKSNLTVTANNSIRCFNQNNPVFTLSYSGFKFTDTEASLSTKPQATTAATASSLPNNYPVTVSGGLSANYNFVYVNGTLRVDALPNATVIPNIQGTIAKGQSLQLTASGGNNYSWSNAQGIISGQNTAVLTIRPVTTTTYTVTVSNNGGCSVVASYTVVVQENIAILTSNNLLSPNNDGQNDFWKVDNIDMYPQATVKVFDRGGRMLYAKKGYDNSWDGTYNGQPLAEGTYYYVIDLNDKRLLRGYITLVRDR
ncbi:FG-GAP-like repeat-containing protein [Pedobacter sp.]|uniref:FG-GAP-like repeat-containing protein n=1 Tax=Pedobacter sp. TaxID=1411316 RepID=UPI0031D39778